VAALGEELDRAEALGLAGLVMHPGSYTTGTEEGGLRLIARGLAGLLRARPRMRARILLEHTAGQGTNLGHRFEHLRAIIEHLQGTDRVGVCLDTCHLLAAGYDVCSEGGYRATFEEFARVVGLDRVKVFHLNDSKKPCGSRVDRHEHIGKGCLGLEPFRMLLNDPRFAGLPMLLETPKLETPESRRKSDLDPWDARNLRTLRRLIAKP
jgi:deoxyribonuclease IV